MKYRPDIDGLRALAIIPVVLYHAGFSVFRGGFVGVDIFFVISGYLITLIINEEIREGRFTLAGFYERRVRRIFPALFTVICCCALWAGGVMLPKGFEQFAQSVVAATLFVANIYFLTISDYFGPAAETKPLLHTWSLSVEEQFYLVFPLLLLLIHRRLGGRWQPVFLPAAALSLIFSIVGTRYFPSASFYLIVTRAWELLLGAFLALGLFPPLQNRTANNLASAAGILMILWSVGIFTRLTPFPGGYALLPCVGAALIIHTGQHRTTPAGRLLGNPGVVFIGLISYSLYLWHWPLMVFARQLFAERYSLPQSVGVVLLSFILAVLSWRYVERPFRRKGTPEGRKTLFATAGAVMTVSVVFGSAVDYSGGWADRFGDRLLSLNCDLTTYNLGDCFMGENQDFSQWRGDKCLLQTGYADHVLLWGDSFAAHYVPGIKDSPRLIQGNLLQYTAGGCAPAFDYDPAYRPRCKEFSAQVEHILSAYAVRSVVMAAGWKLALEHGLTYEDIQRTVDVLRKKGIRVVIIGQSPRFDESVEDISNRARLLGATATKSAVSVDLQGINGKLQEIAGPGNFADPSALFCEGQTCRFAGSDGFYFWDDGHYTVLGSKRAVAYIFSRLKL